MTENANSSNLKDKAKGSLAGNFSVCALILLFYYLICIFIQRFTGTSYFLSVLASVYFSVLSFGLHYFFLKLACGQPVRCMDLFFGLFDAPAKTFALASIHTAVSLITIAPCNILLNMYLQKQPISADTLKMLLLLQVVLLALWVFMQLYLTWTYFLLLDFPQASIPEILFMSVKKMKGQKLRFLLFEISFLPLFLLSVPTFGLALLWVTPYFYTAKAHYYLHVMNP